jgi:hypothetical protein
MSESEEYIGDSYTYNEKLNNLKTEFFSVLEDFKKYYVYYNKNPEVNQKSFKRNLKSFVTYLPTLIKTINDRPKKINRVRLSIVFFFIISANYYITKSIIHIHPKKKRYVMINLPKYNQFLQIKST